MDAQPPLPQSAAWIVLFCTPASIGVPVFSQCAITLWVTMPAIGTKDRLSTKQPSLPEQTRHEFSCASIRVHYGLQACPLQEVANLGLALRRFLRNAAAYGE